MDMRWISFTLQYGVILFVIGHIFRTFRTEDEVNPLQVIGDIHFDGVVLGESIAFLERIDAFLPRTCVLDLRELSFMDSSGVALILRAEREMRDLGGKLVLEHVPEQPLRVLHAAGLRRMIEIRD